MDKITSRRNPNLRRAGPVIAALLLPALWWCAERGLNNWLEQRTARGMTALRAEGFDIDYASRQCNPWPGFPGIIFHKARLAGTVSAPGSGPPREVTARIDWLRVSFAAWPPFSPTLTFGPAEMQARLPGDDAGTIWQGHINTAQVVLRARNAAWFSANTTILATVMSPMERGGARHVVLNRLRGQARWADDAAPDNTILAMTLQVRDVTTDATPSWAHLWPFTDLQADIALLSRSGAYPRGRILLQSLQARTGPPTAPLTLQLTGSLAPSPPPDNKAGALDGAGTLVVDGTTEALDRGLGWLGTDAGAAAFGVQLDPSLVLAMRHLLREHPLPADHVFVPLRLRAGALELPVISRLEKLFGGIDTNSHNPPAVQH